MSPAPILMVAVESSRIRCSLQRPAVAADVLPPGDLRLAVADGDEVAVAVAVEVGDLDVVELESGGDDGRRPVAAVESLGPHQAGGVAADAGEVEVAVAVDVAGVDLVGIGEVGSDLQVAEVTVTVRRDDRVSTTLRCG